MKLIKMFDKILSLGVEWKNEVKLSSLFCTWCSPHYPFCAERQKGKLCIPFSKSVGMTSLGK